MTDYEPFDQREKLGAPPWKSADPKVIEWERAHGHDVRLKCYPEFGCAVLERAQDRLREAAERVVAAWDQFNDPTIRVGPVYSTMRKLQKALDELERCDSPRSSPRIPDRQ